MLLSFSFLFWHDTLFKLLGDNWIEDMGILAFNKVNVICKVQYDTKRIKKVNLTGTAMCESESLVLLKRLFKNILKFSISSSSRLFCP